MVLVVLDDSALLVVKKSIISNCTSEVGSEKSSVHPVVIHSVDSISVEAKLLLEVDGVSSSGDEFSKTHEHLELVFSLKRSVSESADFDLRFKVEVADLPHRLAKR